MYDGLDVWHVGKHLLSMLRILVISENDVTPRMGMRCGHGQGIRKVHVGQTVKTHSPALFLFIGMQRSHVYTIGMHTLLVSELDIISSN